jgi:hypothetical protein
MALLLFLALFALLAALGPVVGADSRESRSWAYRDPFDDGSPLRI